MNGNTSSNEFSIACTISQLLECVTLVRPVRIDNNNAVLLIIDGENVARCGINSDPGEFGEGILEDEFRTLVKTGCTGVARTKSVASVTGVDKAVCITVHRKSDAHVFVVFG